MLSGPLEAGALVSADATVHSKTAPVVGRAPGDTLSCGGHNSVSRKTGRDSGQAVTRRLRRGMSKRLVSSESVMPKVSRTTTPSGSMSKIAWSV